MTAQQRIRWLLAARGLSARELSLKAGVGESYVGQVERGETGENMQRKTAAKIARATGVSAEWVMSGQEPPDGSGPTPETLAVDPPHRDPPASATFGALANWPELVAAARGLDPLIPDWVFERLGSTYAWIRGPVTAAVVVDCARVAWKHEPPPSGR